jgi:ATPase family AAA domain-containing protein 3A/B
MNKKLIGIIASLVFCCCGYADEQKQTASVIPNAFTVGGVKIPTTEALGILGGVTEALNEVSQDTRNYFERQFAAIEQERKQLGARKDSGGVGQAEYDQALKALDARQARLEEEMRQAQKNGQQFSSNMQNLFMSGWQLMLEHQHEEDQRKTKVAQAAVTQAVANEGALERFKFALQKDNLTKVGVFVTATTAGAIGSYYGLSFLYKYLDAILGMPTLVRESSRAGVLSSWLGWAMSTKKQSINPKDAFANVVLAPELTKIILSLSQATAVAHAKGLQYRHLLLYGPPGTGKTLIAKTMARASGMDYAIVSGADFSQFKPGVDVQKLHEVFDWADQGKRGLVLFIDEADALLRSRKELSEQGVKLVNAFLSRTNASSQKFMLILATNYPENLDSAVLSRVNKKVEVPVPGLEERIKLLHLYLNKYLQRQSTEKNTPPLKVDATIDDNYIKDVAQKIDGFSGREVDQLLAEVRIEAFITDKDVVSKDLVDDIVKSKIEQHHKEDRWSKQAGGC